MVEEFDLSELLAAPIRALNEAEAASAVHFVELLLEQMLEPPAAREQTAPAAAGGVPEAGAPRLRQLSFDMQRVEADGRTRTHSLTIPLLQLLPFGGVSIDQATLAYGLTLRAGKARQPRATQGGTPGSRFMGRLAQTRGGGDPATRSDANLDVEVRLRQMDMPQGLLDLIRHTQGILRSDPSPTAPPDPAPVSDEALFQIEILRIESALRPRNPSMKMIVRVIPRQGLGAALALRFAESPRKAFCLAVAGAPAEITKTAQFELSLTGFTAEAVAMLNAGRLGIAIAGKSIDGRSGVEVRHQLLVIPASHRSGEVQS